MTRPAKLDPRYVNRRVILPYELRVKEVEKAVAQTYRLFHGLNDFLERDGFHPLEELLLGNSLSGIISEFLVKNIARASAALEANMKVGGTSRPPSTGPLLIESGLERRRGNRSQDVNSTWRLAGAQPRGLLADGVSLCDWRAGHG